jgi:hypothetical protein
VFFLVEGIPRRAEIQQFYAAIACDLDVIRTDISVDDTVLVQRFQSVNSLLHTFQPE